jgi:hypothetical protein
MKSFFSFFFLLTSLTSTMTKAQNVEAPALEFVCELKVTVDKPMRLGVTSHGERRIIPITGGTFEGPQMKGIILNGGADYQFVNKENTRTEIEAIYTIQTEDGVLIHIRNVGLVIKTLENAEKLAKGEPMDASKNYFRAAPKFEAPEGSKYDWLNNAIFVCKGVPAKGGVSIFVWKVL